MCISHPTRADLTFSQSFTLLPSVLRIHFQVPYPVTPLLATLTKNTGGWGAHSSRFGPAMRVVVRRLVDHRPLLIYSWAGACELQDPGSVGTVWLFPPSLRFRPSTVDRRSRPALDRQPPRPLTPFNATSTGLPVNVANKRLTDSLNPLDATFTQNTGYPPSSRNGCPQKASPYTVQTMWSFFSTWEKSRSLVAREALRAAARAAAKQST